MKMLMFTSTLKEIGMVYANPESIDCVSSGYRQKGR